MAAAEERQHVVLAEAIERNVLDEHHLVVVLVEHSACDDVGRADAVTVGQLAERSRYAARRRFQALPRWILAKVGQQRLDQVGYGVALGELRLGHCVILTQLIRGCDRGRTAAFGDRISAAAEPQGGLSSSRLL